MSTRFTRPRRVTVVIAVADEVDESVRDLTRTRSDAVDDLQWAQQRRKSFLLRQGYHYHGTADWSDKHLRYLRHLMAYLGLVPHEHTTPNEIKLPPRSLAAHW
jgi:transposase